MQHLCIKNMGQEASVVAKMMFHQMNFCFSLLPWKQQVQLVKFEMLYYV